MELKSSGLHWTTVFLLFYISSFSSVECVSTIMGKRTPCFNEGEPIAVTHIDKRNCYSCSCKNGFVECQIYADCPKTEGCHMLVEKTEDGCCQKCQGCVFRGKVYESNTEWQDDRDPCKVMRCEAGVITQSTLRCHTPCDNPQPAGPKKCCPTCPDCSINGQIAMNDREVTSDDPCVKCRCEEGRMTCSKQACPVLQCGPWHQVQREGECCPRCVGTRILHKPQGKCILYNEIYENGAQLKPNQCTICECQNETSLCVRESCPVLDCAPNMMKKKPKSCCTECKEPRMENFRQQCTYEEKTYEEGAQWKLDDCSSCTCHKGMPSCAKTRCNATLSCPPGTKLVRKKGECCEVCKENDGVCMVFGDPHYKSFDGKFFSFQGIGKYQLVSDCHAHSFSIRVANMFKTKDKTSTSTKRVSIKYGDIRVILGQRFRTRVNGYEIQIPYKKDGRIRIEREKDKVLLTLSNGVQLLWSGRSFLEVTVPTSFRSRLCGLCGNFNTNVQDDMRVRKGPVVNDTQLMRFGTSWCVGKNCARQRKRTEQMRPCRRKPRDPFVERNCKYLKSSELWNGCTSKLNNLKYLEACVTDMCDCPGGKCYCESLTAYAQECQRLGVTLRNWQDSTYCSPNELRQADLALSSSLSNTAMAAVQAPIMMADARYKQRNTKLKLDLNRANIAKPKVVLARAKLPLM